MQSDNDTENQAGRPLLAADSSAAAPAALHAKLPAMPQPAEPSERASTLAGRASGRPLDENVDAAILDATWRLLLRDGYARMSIARVAEEARVGRPAIYRRYRDKSELVAAVIADKSSRVPPVDTGSARDDLIAHLEFARRRFTMGLAGTLIVEEHKHPELLRQFREGMLVPRRDQIAAALERGKARGEVRADLDCTLAAHAVMGSFVYHSLAVGRPAKGWSDQVIDTLWRGFSSASDHAA
jgi:AcrR family transcriptional regulator